MMGINDFDSMNLWKVNIAKKEETSSKMLILMVILKLKHKFVNYFPTDQKLDEENIHLIIQVSAITGKCLPMFISRTRNLQSKQ
jgi:hypothetical protein